MKGPSAWAGDVALDLVIAPGPGNGKELMDHLAWTDGARVKLAWSAEEIANADLLVTPRGPSRSFSDWYRTDPVGQAVVEAHQQGTTWLAFCGSALPLVSQVGEGCAGVHPLSMVAAKGRNNRCQGPGVARLADGTEYPFHYTSAPTFEALDGEDGAVLARARNGDGVILKSADLVLSSGLPMSKDGWRFLFDQLEIPLSGARLSVVRALGGASSG